MKAIFTSVTKPKNMQQNKTVAKLLPGVYELSCDYRRKYIGDAKKKKTCAYSINQTSRR